MRYLPLVFSTFPHSQTGSFPAYLYTVLSVYLCSFTVIVRVCCVLAGEGGDEGQSEQGGGQRRKTG